MAPITLVDLIMAGGSLIIAVVGWMWYNAKTYSTVREVDQIREDIQKLRESSEKAAAEAAAAIRDLENFIKHQQTADVAAQLKTTVEDVAKNYWKFSRQDDVQSKQHKGPKDS